MSFKRNILANQKRISLYKPLQSYSFFLISTIGKNLSSSIRLRKCIAHICDCTTVPVTWRGELKREQSDSFKKLRSSAENVWLAVVK